MIFFLRDVVFLTNEFLGRTAIFFYHYVKLEKNCVFRVKPSESNVHLTSIVSSHTMTFFLMPGLAFWHGEIGFHHEWECTTSQGHLEAWFHFWDQNVPNDAPLYFHASCGEPFHTKMSIPTLVFITPFSLSVWCFCLTGVTYSWLSSCSPDVQAFKSLI